MSAPGRVLSCLAVVAVSSTGGLFTARAQSKAPRFETTLFLASDLGARGADIQTGFKLVSKVGPWAEGFVLQGIAGSGAGKPRPAAGPGRRWTGTNASLSVGREWSSGPLHVTALLGASWRDKSYAGAAPVPGDAGARFGLRAEADLWWRPATDWLVTFTAIGDSAERSTWARLSGGRAILGNGHLGPEFVASSSRDGTRWRLGAHWTGVEWGGFWLRASAGWETGRGEHAGAYATGVIARKF